MNQQRGKGLVFAVSLYLTCFFGTLVLLMPLIPLALKLPRLGRGLMDFMFWLWLVFAAAMYELLLQVKVVIHGEPAPPDHSVLILCNHRTRLDWLFLYSYQLRCGDLSRYRISLKDSLRAIPGPGWAMQCAGFLFLKREWKMDKDWISLALKYFAQMGTRPQFLLFPEGTDFCENGLAKSDKFAEANGLPKYEYVLHPRTTGFVHFVNEMKQNGILDSVLDITVGYPENIVHGEADIGRGIVPKEVHFYVENRPASQLPESVDQLESMCRDIWQEKEQRLKKFYKDRTFAVNGEGSAVWQERERHVQLLFWCVIGFWAVFMAGVGYALLVWPLFRWYCVLGSLTFVIIGRSCGGVDALLYANAL